MAAVLAVGLVAVLPGAAPAGADGGLPGVRPGAVAAALPPGVPFVTLQLNLCNSGLASCYARYNQGRSVGEAAGIITAQRPDVVTLNEVCRADVATALYPVMARNFPGEHTFWEFLPAAERAGDGRPYRCRNGDEYGIGVLGRVRAAQGTVTTQVFSGRYPQQDTSSNEMRVWLCVAAPGSFAACTTHLASTSGTIALQQCRRLMEVELPALRATIGTAVPVVVAGDLNLRYGGSPNAQSCVPPGWYRKGDGNVQHFMATIDLGFSSSTKVNTRYTDHDGWQVVVRP
ncbi:MAG TPA: endonuclease/exonuclease/phosphatase family protein [Catenuloplanes sp.]|jgi:endonuclease/exonuclease/phosphatase family metal-dependent hydrolase